MKRASGILLPVFSLPSPYGIGTFGKAAYDWIDFLSRAKQQYWQILPLGPTSYGDSPYQSFSSFAGNPYFIDIDFLKEEGLLTEQECEDFSCENENEIQYDNLFKKRYLLLEKAFGRFEDKTKLREFYEQQKQWLEDYSLYMAIKQENQHHEWTKWPKELKLREKEALAQAKKRLHAQVEFHIFLQYEFFKQWQALKKYAHQKGVYVIGDVPIYVAMDSSDTWANRDIFQMNEEGYPTEVSGCPPDSFSADGQLWGNPLYNWEKLKANEYDWWMKRIQASFEMADVLRIDHFRGFESYYAIPYGDTTARNGRWRRGPNFDFIDAIHKAFPNQNIIAEDLGFLTPQVKELLRYSGYPGMKVLQFAFDTREDGDYLPHNYERNCVVYTGTHDNDTLCGWLKNAFKDDIEHARHYLAIEKNQKEQHWCFIRAALASVADLAVIPIQDYLGLGEEARINTPSTIGQNWKWRMKSQQLSDELAARIADQTKLYGRAVKE